MCGSAAPASGTRFRALRQNRCRLHPPSSATSGIRRSLGWQPRWTASWRARGPCSRPSSCCPGRSPGAGGRKVHGPGPAQHVGHLPAEFGPLHHHRQRQMGRATAIPMYPLYLSVLVSAEKKFWRCVQSGEPPPLINAEPPRPRIETIRIVDMSSSNSWAEFAALFRNTRGAFLDHERANRAQSLGPRGRQGGRSGMACGPSARNPAR